MCTPEGVEKQDSTHSRSSISKASESPAAQETFGSDLVSPVHAPTAPHDVSLLGKRSFGAMQSVGILNIETSEESLKRLRPPKPNITPMALDMNPREKVSMLLKEENEFKVCGTSQTIS